MKEKAPERKVCKSKNCVVGEMPQPIDNFYISRTKNNYRATVCKSCKSVVIRTVFKRGKPKRFDDNPVYYEISGSGFENYC